MNFIAMKDLLLIACFLASLNVAAQDVSSWICDILAPSNEAVKVNSQPLADEVQVRAIYDSLDCRALWYNETKLLDNAYILLEQIKDAEWDGLELKDYGHQALLDHVRGLDDINLRLFLVPAEEIAVIDILLTDAALSLGSDLRMGKSDPEQVDLMWEIPRDSINMTNEFLAAISYEDKGSSALNFVPAMRPQYPQYEALREAYRHLQAEPEDSLKIELPDDILLKPGEEGVAVLAIRRKMDQLYGKDTLNTNFFDTLSVDTVTYFEDSIGIDLFRKPVYQDEICIDTLHYSDDSIFVLIDTFQSRMDEIIVTYDTVKVNRDSLIVSLDTIYRAEFYDSLLVERVKRYQTEHALNADGVVGPKTLRRMTISKQQKLTDLLINLETWKWMPRQFPERHLIVNISGFFLDVMEYDSIVHTKKVMVGTVRNRTPVFSEIMEYIEFNPYWNVTYNIASKEILPNIKRNPSYLANNNYELFSGGKKINPSNVDWSTVSRSAFPYSIRQKPGRRNALGLVKFMFPNEYSVYLHDTPSKPKFALASRALSHGCVRLQNPMQLAEYLLKDQGNWDMEKIDGVLARRKNKRVNLDSPVPITLHYQTVYVDTDGLVHYMDDVYSRNGAVKKALGL